MERPPCTDPRCGQPKAGAGRPPVGWVLVKVSGDRAEAIMFCTPRHAADWLGSFTVVRHGHTVVEQAQPIAMPTLLALLNRAAGTFLTPQTATPRRVRDVLDRAASAVLNELDDWQARQDRHRPTLAQVQDEMATGRISVEDLRPRRRGTAGRGGVRRLVFTPGPTLAPETGATNARRRDD